MENILAIGEVATAVLASFSIAFLLEWLGLRGLMRLMPTTARQNEPSGIGRQRIVPADSLGTGQLRRRT